MTLRSFAFSSLFALSLAAVGCATQADDASGETSADLASAAPLAHDYRGTVAGLDVVVRIEASASRVSGSYYYVGKVTKGETIALAGTLDGGRLSMDETVGGTKTGSFAGSLGAGGALRGTWTAPSGRRSDFALQPVRSPAVVRRAVKDATSVSDPETPFNDCHVDTKYVDVIGLSDAAAESALNQALAMDAAPLEKNPQGKCDWWYSLDSVSTVRLYEHDLIVVELSSESNGGAYPNHSLMWVNASTKTGKVLTLADIVAADKMTALRDKTKAIYKARPDGVDDFLLQIVDESFESPADVQFELTKRGLRISMFNALPHAAQAEDGDGALVTWSDLSGMLIATSPAAVLAH